MAGVSRRFVLGGMAAGLAGEALGAGRPGAPFASPRPVLRPVATVAARTKGLATPAAELIAAAGLGGTVGFVVADAATGLVLEAVAGDMPLPPASTAKTITALYALDHLGAGYRFSTRLIATGPLRGGVIAGDLILAGGGDPALSTDDLGDLAADLARAGVRGIAGRFRVWGGALPYLAEIDPGQPDWLGYNPAVSGLNLNFNRVNFVWKRGKGGYDLGMDARTERFAPAVYSARIRAVDRDLPIYTYAKGSIPEEWTVARRALGKGGSRWLPVRRPELYAGDVFQTLARGAGIALPAPAMAQTLPEGTVIAARQSAFLRILLRDMMKYSTNLTAEAIGMAASARRGIHGHAASGRAMTDWLARRLGGSTARLIDHSGLGSASRIAAADMVRALVALGPAAELRGLMKDIPMTGADNRPVKNPAARIVAKTGTLNFVSALAGYMTTADGTDLAFTILTGDVARRDAIPENKRERPDGAADWVRRSKRLQQQLIARWAAVYGA